MAQAADPAGGHLHKLQVEAGDAEFLEARELQEIVEVGRELEAGGVAGQAGAGARADQRGLVGGVDPRARERR